MEKYLLVIIEECKDSSGGWVVNAQDGSLPMEVHRGTHDACKTWASINAEEVIGC